MLRRSASELDEPMAQQEPQYTGRCWPARISSQSCVLRTTSLRPAHAAATIRVH